MERVLMMDSGDGTRRADNGSFGKGGAVLKTTSFTLTKHLTGTFYVNRGALGTIVATLPTAVKGLWYGFGRPTAQTFTITAAGGAKIDGGSANGSITIPSGGLVTIVCDGTDWFSMTTLSSVALSALAQGTNGQLIVAQTSASPLYKTVSGDVTITNNGVVAIGAQKVLASMLVRGTNGQLIIGQTSADPAYTTISGDATLSELGVLTLADGLTHTASVTLSNVNIKALRATPITIVAAPGASKVLSFLSATLVLKAGANVLSESAANLAFKYNNGSGVAVSNDVECTGFIDQATDTITSATAKLDAIVASSAGTNKALVIHNTGAGEFGANAAADATMLVHVSYRIRPT